MNKEIAKLLEQAAETAVFADAADAPSLEALTHTFVVIAEALRADGPPPCAAAALTAVARLASTRAGRPDATTALDLASQTLTALQAVFRDGRDPAAVAFFTGREGETPPAPTVQSESSRLAPDPATAPCSAALPLTIEAVDALQKGATPSSRPAASDDKAKQPNQEQQTMNDKSGPAAETRAGTAQSQAGKYLTFKLGPEEYGLEILKVQEIIKMMDITKVPRTPEFVRGVINLRGKVIPVVDLRRKFEMPSIETTEKTCVIVVQVARAGAKITMGAIVDEVSEVLDVLADQIEPPPEFGTSVDTDFILGMGKVGKKVVILLDVDKVLSAGELAEVARPANVA